MLKINGKCNKNKNNKESYKNKFLFYSKKINSNPSLKVNISLIIAKIFLIKCFNLV